MRLLVVLAGLGTALVVVTAPARHAGGAALEIEVQERPVVPGSDTAQARVLLGAVRGADPVLCELALHALEVSWTPRLESPIPDRNPEAWTVVSWATHRIRDPLAVPLLAAALSDADRCVRRTAARLLGMSRLPAARTRLTEALRNPEPGVRRLGAMGLGFAGDRSDVPVLVRALEDRDAGVRAAAAWALGALH